ncbi:zinc finger RNA-binding protein isoform X2 [Stomoxys calcitrans]|uniref:DZF domain-containing protein n=1 Tax=Stomoxys calcitrans TaxID=35570 RepID=A0A1I8PE16_STOCA|nr:zinc finger RNA-binding protein isoform X2 [Stomoxys calcitrans]XP_013111188.1 zinc finger RNA-binding protein isoform X2 [Stomoxys calcitrans]
MANNYAGFSYGGTQYTSTGAPAAGSGSYAAGGGAAAAAGYAGYGNDYASLQAYDSSKTFYQQAASSYSAAPSSTAGKTHYSAPPVKNVTPIGTKPSAGKDKCGPGGQAKMGGPAVTTASGSYSNYDAALYSAASMYVAQQHQPGQHAPGGGNPGKSNGVMGGGGNWPPYRKGGPGGPGNKVTRPKQPPRPQQLHYCEVCKISCAGPQTYREHLEGQKHKKREASLKMQASAQTTTQNRGNNYHCELCDVTCTGTDAYAAHVRGAKHQKVVKLHQKLGKPIPADEPKKMGKINFVPASGSNNAADGSVSTKEGDSADNQSEANKTDENQDESSENLDNIKPVGGEYIEEVKDEEGKILSFNCKLCDCKFNDPNAKEMHTKGRRHRLQYKRKVQPDLVVDFKPTPRQRRLAEARAQRALMSSHRGQNSNFGDKQGYWGDEQRRRAQFDDEYDYNNWLARSFGGNQRGFGGRMGNGPPPFFGMIPGGAGIRRPESNDDRHAIARHAQIYPKEEELQLIQRIVSHTERALKFVSDTLAENPNDSGPSTAKKERSDGNAVKDGRDNQMLSFQKEADTGNLRILKGVMRVGFLAKGLLLQGDTAVELVVLCSEKPTVSLLKRVAAELPQKLKEVAGENPVDYKVDVVIDESAVMVQDETVSVKISLTSPLLRESPEGGQSSESENGNAGDAAPLPREPCLKALAELRHAKWFQARATGLQSCVMVIRILRDLCQRVQSWQALPQWSMELFVEKVISSAGFPISPGDCLRRIMEALASGFLINGPGLLDPCEKEPQDALQDLSKQQREDLTVSAQLFLRYMAFRQIFKVLGMDQLPAPKFPSRPWRLNRKRRRSQGKDNVDTEGNNVEAEECASDEKIPKKDADTS